MCPLLLLSCQQASKQAEVTKLQEEISKVQHDFWTLLVKALANKIVMIFFLCFFFPPFHQLTDKLKKKQER